MHPGGDAPPIIDDRDAPIDMDGDLNRLPEARHVFVYAVVDHLIDEMMQAVDARAADIHRRPLAHRIEPFEDFDLVRTVAVGFGLGRLVRGHYAPLLQTSRRLTGCSKRSRARPTNPDPPGVPFVGEAAVRPATR